MPGGTAVKTKLPSGLVFSVRMAPVLSEVSLTVAPEIGAAGLIGDGAGDRIR